MAFVFFPNGAIMPSWKPEQDGERYEFERYFRPDRNPVVLEVLGRDTLDVPAGRIPTTVCSVIRMTRLTCKLPRRR